MLLVPHIRIARRVNDVMRNKFQIKLSRAVFAFGSIYPDLVKRNRTRYMNTCVKSPRAVGRKASAWV